MNRPTVLVFSVFIFAFLVGCQGAAGAAGAPGTAGLQGNPGPTGLQGPEGPQGDAGISGDVGSAGPIGSEGSAGPTGPTGPAGPTGIAGSKGAIGPKGQAGATGPTGGSGPAGGDFYKLFVSDNDIKNHVIWIEAGSSNGSAVVIGAGELLTAEHVITGKSLVQASIPGIGLVNAVVKGWDKTRDLALLTFNSTGGESVATLSSGTTWNGDEWTSNGQLGSPVVAVGFVTSVSNTVPMTSFGHIATWWNIVPGEISTLGFDADVTNGMSGGGLFDIDGDLVGIVTQKSNVIQSDNRAVRFDEIQEVLAELRAGANNP